jgi:hypothetical protein
MQAVAAELHRCPPCRAAPAASLPRCAAAASRGEKSLRFALCPGGHPAWRCKDALLTWHSADVAHGAGRQTAAEAAEVAVLRAERGLVRRGGGGGGGFADEARATDTLAAGA